MSQRKNRANFLIRNLTIETILLLKLLRFLSEHFKSISLFIGGNVRKAVNEGRADCIPIFLHEIPRIFNEGIVKPDMALIHVSSPDEQGYCSLGTSVDSVRSAVVNAKVVVGKKILNLNKKFTALNS